MVVLENRCALKQNVAVSGVDRTVLVAQEGVKRGPVDHNIMPPITGLT